MKTTYQVGGNHYQSLKIQPIELIIWCKWDFIQGNIAKYVLRYKHKNGEVDLRKAYQYAEFGTDALIPDSKEWNHVNHLLIENFCETNHLDREIKAILDLIEQKKWFDIRLAIDELISKTSTTQRQ